MLVVVLVVEAVQTAAAIVVAAYPAQVARAAGGMHDLFLQSRLGGLQPRRDISEELLK